MGERQDGKLGAETPMRDYSPKLRTALVLAGTGAAGAYHAGVLKALDESGVKVDVVVGSGAGAIAAAFAAVSGGEKLYGADGFWPGSNWPVRIARRSRATISARRVVSAIGLKSAFAIRPLPRKPKSRQADCRQSNKRLSLN